LLSLGATIQTDRRTFPLADLYRLPTESDRNVTTLEPNELILYVNYEPPDASTYLKAMDRARFSFPLLGVAAARYGGDVRLALSGVAPVPWVLGSAAELEEATPLPGTAYKVELARVLVRRALAQVAA
jgi:xanthine dehydrogenase YagS FAD-binding subunit